MTNYNHISHTHCWDNKSNPCGIPMEKHTQCCLCDLKIPENAERTGDKGRINPLQTLLQKQSESFDDKFPHRLDYSYLASDFKSHFTSSQKELLELILKEIEGKEKPEYHPNNQYLEDAAVTYNSALTDLTNFIKSAIQ